MSTSTYLLVNNPPTRQLAPCQTSIQRSGKRCLLDSLKNIYYLNTNKYVEKSDNMQLRNCFPMYLKMTQHVLSIQHISIFVCWHVCFDFSTTFSSDNWLNFNVLVVYLFIYFYYAIFFWTNKEGVKQ